VRPLACLVLLALSAGCGGGSVDVSWRFADESRCGEAGVASVVLTPSGVASSTFNCPDALLPFAITLANLASDGSVAASAVSPAGTALYAGEAAVDGQSRITITLYATAAR
jgi:hypothetical protein